MRFQSTLPRGERPCGVSSVLFQLSISIHAPTRGATMYQSKIRHIAIDFNPRSHEGSDRFSLHQLTIYEISIHAPTRGATLRCIKCFIPVINFNPRSHEGSDNVPKQDKTYCDRFQSTLPRGERPLFASPVNDI